MRDPGPACKYNPLAAISPPSPLISHWQPTRILYFLALAGALACLASVVFLLRQPWLGVELAARPDGIRVVGVPRGGAAVPVGAAVLGLASAEGRVMPLEPADLVELPDLLPDYASAERFFARQTRFAELLAAPGTRLVWRTPEGATQASPLPDGRRPLASLPARFWVGLASALGLLLIAAWVYALRPQEGSARLFALGGLLVLAGILSDALQGSRELALPGDVFLGLSQFNHLAALAYGGSIVGLLCIYPQRLPGTRRALPALFAFYLLWWLLDTARVFPGVDVGTGLPILSQVLLASLLALRQWRASRDKPLERTALRWFALAFLGGAWLFVFLSILPQITGAPMPIAQIHADSLLVLAYLGMAVGVRRHRLFDLDPWAWRVLFLVLGSMLVTGFDLLLVWGLHVGPLASLGLALFLAGWVYFPLRQWLWLRLAGRPAGSLEEALPDLIDIAFSVSAAERERRWRRLLQRLFAPLHLAPLDDAPAAAGLDDGGQALRLPAQAGMPGYVMRHADRGRRLFGARDVAFAEALHALLLRAAHSRDAYERGVNEERVRIYRDLHDDIGAKLLTLAIGPEHPQRADIARAAMQDLRDVVSRSGQGAVPLSHHLADWRAEIGGRLDAAGLRLHWRQPDDLPDPEIGPETALHLGRILREAISNVLRHAGASLVEVSFGAAEGRLHCALRDDGRGLAGDAALAMGRGLRNMRARAGLLAAEISWEPAEPTGCRVRLSVPGVFAAAGDTPAARPALDAPPSSSSQPGATRA
jgi:signal transduction histidine kinase